MKFQVSETYVYLILILLVFSIASFIKGKYIMGFILLGIFIIAIAVPYLRESLNVDKKILNLRAESSIPKLIESFHTYGQYMADYKMYTAQGAQYGWVMPGRKAISLVNQFIRFGRIDIPVKMLCEGVEREFEIYDRGAGLTPILDQSMEARLRLLSSIAQLTNSEQLKYKITQYIKECRTRKVNLHDGILDDPLPSYMI
jgi:hypothetical protein